MVALDYAWWRKFLRQLICGTEQRRVATFDPHLAERTDGVCRPPRADQSEQTDRTSKRVPACQLPELAPERWGGVEGVYCFADRSPEKFRS